MAKIDLFIFVLSIFSLIVIGIYKTKKNVLESTYLVADRKISLFALVATLVMTEFNSATLIAFSSIGYEIGYYALFFPLIFLIGLMFYAIAVSKKWKQYNGLSVAGFFTKKYGPGLGRIASILLLLSMMGFTASYVKSMYILFLPIFNMNQWVLTAGIVFAIVMIVLREGLVSIIRTDVVSFLMTLVIFPLILYFVYKGGGNSFERLSFSNDFSFKFLLSLVVLTMFTYILAPWYGQKIFSARSEKTAYLSVVFAAVFVFILYTVTVLTTVFLKKKNVILVNAELAYPRAISMFLPRGLKGLAYFLLFATSATTLTGVWNAMSAMVVADFLKIKKSALRSKIITISFAVLSYVLANVLIDRIFDKMILANIPVAALCFALLAGFYWDKASKTGVYISIVVGVLCGILSYVILKEEGMYTWYWAMYGVPLIFISGFIGSVVFPDKVRVEKYN